MNYKLSSKPRHRTDLEKESNVAAAETFNDSTSIIRIISLVNHIVPSTIEYLLLWV